MTDIYALVLIKPWTVFIIQKKTYLGHSLVYTFFQLSSGILLLSVQC